MEEQYKKDLERIASLFLRYLKKEVALDIDDKLMLSEQIEFVLGYRYDGDIEFVNNFK